MQWKLGSLSGRVPRDRKGNAEYRRQVLRGTRTPEEVGEIEACCRADPLFYFNVFGYGFDPEGGGPEPFITWPAQERALGKILDAVRYRRTLPVEKSRRQGGTWLVLLAFEWLWHFHPYMQFMLVSRVGELVDSESPDSMFWKLDFFWKHLPAWLRPNMERSSMVAKNLDNDSIFNGYATTSKVGVGGRATGALFDEFALVRNDVKIFDMTRDTTKCRVFVSTHTGTGTKFYQLCQDYDVVRLHWSENPACNRGLYRYHKGENRVEILDREYMFPPDYHFVMTGEPSGGPYPGLRSPWYDNECRERRSKRAVAMNLDINAAGSSVMFFDELEIKELRDTYAVPALWEGDVVCDDQGRDARLVQRRGGPLRLWCQLGAEDRPAAGLFAIAADLSRGTGATNSCLSIGNARTGEKVGEYTTPTMRPDQMAPRAVGLCWLFRTPEGEGAYLAWELHGPGVTFGIEVTEKIGYRRVYCRKNEGVLGMPESGGDPRPGWSPMGDNKSKLLENYRSALLARTFLNRSDEALAECLMFRYNQRGEIEHDQEEGGDDPSGARMNHADRVIADGLANKMMDELGQRRPANRSGREAAAPAHLATPAGRWQAWQEAERRRREDW